MAGQCRPSPIYKEVTLKGGINAGTYKDVGGVNTMEECQKKCCEFPVCDLSFMLAGSCYLVGCNDQKQCAMQPAKESKFHPMISYVTRWNNEGVKHTVLLQEKGVQHTCGKLAPLMKVTLKGGLQAGEFTDVGKVSNLAQCYDICCQQDNCDLAFMLGQNCFSVQCKDKRLCTTIPAQPSIFNPQIAYVTKRERTAIAKSGIPKPNAGISGECPVTKVFEKMTLKGGVDAGAYKDHGKVKSMDVCRRICCEMTECHLAFMLGSNCFSVKCASVDACRAQKAKPSAYFPKISYIRKVGSNELLRSTVPLSNHSSDALPASNALSSSPLLDTLSSQLQQQKIAQQALLSKQRTNMVAPIPSQQKLNVNQVNNQALNINQVSNQQGFAVTPNGLLPINSTAGLLNNGLSDVTGGLNKQINGISSNNVSSSPTTLMSNTSTTKGAALTTTDKLTSTTTETLTTTTGTTKSQIPNNETLGVNDTMLTKDQDLMRALESNDPKDAPPKANSTAATQPMPVNQEKCSPGILKSNVTLKGGRKSGEFREIKGLKDMKTCVARCCEDRDKKCNLAFMLGDTCYSVSCKTKELCHTIPAPPTKFNPLVQYVRGLEEEPIPPTTATTTATVTTTTTSDDVELSSDNSASTTTSSPKKENQLEKTKEKQQSKNKLKSCVSQPIVKEKSIKGGKKAGKFKIFKEIKDMDSCMAKCCSLKKQCDVAYMEDSKCFTIQCFKKSACTAVELRESDVNPKFAYMDHFLEKVDAEEAASDSTSDSTDLDVSEESSCVNVEVISNKTLKGGTKAGKFRPMGKQKNMKSCINSCCDRPDCDIAYLLNDHCYAVECTDGNLCQSTDEPLKTGDNVQLAYMNKASLGEKQRDYMVVYIIVGSLAFAATLGGLIWMVFAFSRKQRIKKTHNKRLLDDQDDEDEQVDDIIHKRNSHSSRHRQPRY